MILIPCISFQHYEHDEKKEMKHYMKKKMKEKKKYKKLQEAAPFAYILQMLANHEGDEHKEHGKGTHSGIYKGHGKGFGGFLEGNHAGVLGMALAASMGRRR